MSALSKYIILDEVQQNGYIKILRGYIRDSKAQVILKLLNKEAFNLVEASRLANEYEITRNLNIDGIIKPIALERTDSHFALVLPDIKAMPLKEYIKSYAVGPWLFTDIAVQIAEIIGLIHDQGIVHGNLSPDSILIHPDTVKVYISGFGNAISVNSRNHNLSQPVPDSERAPQYISPEQTGRLNVKIDQRSDLYSIGVIFYEMLTGRLPFTADRESQWIYAHISARPKPINSIRSDIPSAICSMVMKLLEKKAEDRYQSAYGLLWDIRECRKQLIEAGRIDNVAIGRRDIVSSFCLPNILYGRDAEKEQLKAVFEKVCEGSAEAVCISGYEGVGKTTLVNQTLKPLTYGKGYFIFGKADEMKRDKPYAPFQEAFRSLIQQLLTEGEEELAYWRKRILNVFKKNCAVITEFMPDLEYIIGKQPPADMFLGKESESRIFSMFKDFIGIFASKGRPLVVFLDDLQWASADCIRLIEYLASEPKLYSLLLIAAYRYNEENEVNPVARLHEGTGEGPAGRTYINLHPLNWRQTLRLTADTLHTSQEKVTILSEMLYCKTGGNPLFLKQLLKDIYDRKILYFDVHSGSWKWKDEALQSLSLDKDIMQLFVSKLGRIPEEARNVLKLASCIGSSFDLRTLSIVMGRTVEETASSLITSVHEGLILPVRDQNEGMSLGHYQVDQSAYRFLNDKVRQAVYSLIDENEKKEKHLAIGRLLLQITDSGNSNQRILSIMNHFNRSLELVDDAEERLRLAGYNLQAGRIAKASAEYESALLYFRYGKMLLTDNSWQDDHKLSYDLYLELAQVEYLLGNTDAAEELFDTVIEKSVTEVERAGVYSIKMLLYARIGKYNEAVTTGIVALGNLGIKITEHPAWMDYARELLVYKWNMKTKKIEELIDLPDMDDAVQIMAAELLGRLSTVTMTSHFELYTYIIIKAANHVIRHGNTYMAPVGYFGCCFYTGSIKGNYLKADRYAKVCSHLIERYGNKDSESIVYLAMGALNVHWTRHMSYSLDYLKKAIASGKEAGDILVVGYANCLIMETSYFMGRMLADLVPMIQEVNEIAGSLKHDNLGINAAIYERVISALQGQDGESLDNGIAELNNEEFIVFVQGDKSSLATCYFHKLHLNYIAGNYQEALAAARNIEPVADNITGLVISSEYNFYYSLAIAAAYGGLDSQDKRRYWKVLRKNQQQMKKWAGSCKENFLHKYLLVNAEIARLQNKASEAMKLYSQAIKSAHENGYIQVEALANELAAKFYLSLGMNEIAGLYLQDSCSAYERWGAAAKVRQLNDKYSALIDMNFSTRTDGNDILYRNMLSISVYGTGKAAIDYYYLEKAVESLSQETDPYKLLADFLDITAGCIGADRGYVIFSKKSELFIRAVKDSNSGAVIIKPVPLEQSCNLSKSIIRYAARTNQIVIVNCGEQESSFDTDPYIAQSGSRSIAAVPLLFQGKAIGVLYLENSLMAGVFTNELLDSLKLLTTQMACVERLQCYLESDASNAAAKAPAYLVEPLTEREIQVLNLINKGMSNNEIADDLNITINTVKSYIKNIYQKMGVNRRVQVIARAKELNILNNI